jgi:hypothetical protein
MLCVVSPVDQEYESAADDVTVTTSPEHACVLVALIVGVGALETFTEIGVEALTQPFASVTVTE